MELSDLICGVERRATIVGVDPGTTAAWAVLDLGGELLGSGSGRGAGMDRLLEEILVYGSPAIVATDVTPAPETVEKMASAVDAELWEPDGEDMKVEEKRDLTADHDPENDHERDALAAALRAHASNRNLFERVARRTPDELDADRVKERVLRGNPIADAVRELQSGPEEEGEEPDRTVERETLLSRQARTISRLREQVESLDSELEEARSELEEAEERVERLRTGAEREAIESRKVERLRSEVSRLNRLLDEEKERTSRLTRRINESRRGHLVEERGLGRIAFRLPDLTVDNVERKADAFDLSGHPVYVESGSGAGRSGIDLLSEEGVEAVISEERLPHHAEDALDDHEVPLIEASDLEPRKREAFAILDEEEYLSTLESARSRLEERKAQELNSLIEQVAEELG